MKKNNRDLKLWWIQALLHVLVIECAASLYLDAADGEAHLRAAFVLGFVAFVLVITDVFTMMGALG